MLTDLEIKNTKPGDKPFKLSDSGGLYVLVKPSGVKLWQMAFRFGGKQKTLSFGAYPKVGLTAARAKREEAKDMLRDGLDPALQKQLAKITGAETRDVTFDKIADEFIERRRKDGAAEKTIIKTTWQIKQARPALGARPIADITPAEVYAVLKKIERSGRLDTARAVRATCSRVFRHAIVTARATQDPCAPLIGSTVAPTVTHHASLFEPKEIGGLLRAIRSYEGEVTRNAMILMSLTFVRSQELRFAAWPEFDLERAMWSIPAKRMKMKLPHIVPLSRQAIELLTGMKARAKTELLFPGLRSSKRPISDMTVNAALRRMGYSTDEMTGHGFRRMASTVLNENKKAEGFDADWIERQLAHKEPNEIRRAYDASKHLEGRTTMMQWWADWLDKVAAQDLPAAPKPADAELEDLIG